MIKMALLDRLNHVDLQECTEHETACLLFVDYVHATSSTLTGFTTDSGSCRGYNDHAIALNCGVMLRDALRDPQIAMDILESPLLDEFFRYVQVCCTVIPTLI
jgi:Mo25-like